MKRMSGCFRIIRVMTLGVIGMMSIDAHTQTYPAKPVRVVVGFTPGAGADTITRMFIQKFPDNLAQAFLVENRPGAGSAIAIDRVAKSAPDGYTLLALSSSAPIISALRQKSLPYDLERDIAPISMAAIGPLVVAVNASVPVSNIRELIAHAQSREGRKLTYASSGLGSSAHLAAELLAGLGKVSFSHIPYKGSGDAVAATMSGEVQMSFPSLTESRAALQSGKVRALAITTSRRVTALPGTPALAEFLPDYDFPIWYGFAAPAGTPKEILDRASYLVNRAGSHPDIRESLRPLGLDPNANSPEEFAAYVRRMIKANADLIRLAGIKEE